MKANIGISSDSRAAVSEILNKLLCDEYVLYTKTRNFHWNVVGPNFSELHKFFQTQYEELDVIVDETAERVRSLGECSYGSLAEFSKSSRLKEQPGKLMMGKDMVAALLSDHESLCQTLREDLDTCGTKYKDMGTSDFLTGLMEQHEKMAWMLRSWLQG